MNCKDDKTDKCKLNKYRFNKYVKKDIITDHLDLGGTSPDGGSITVNSLYIERNGKPYIPVMGEYHFCRDSREHWYEELCKMKAGGITAVATYLFWIYHEETEGQFNFSKDLDIRKFVLDAKKAGLDVVLRIGPWVHGECRNGGFPDWLCDKPYKLRENNPQYLEKARIWYEKIFEQVKGLLYKDGGNIIAVQIENELVWDAKHIEKLVRIAIDVGFDVPLYTVTGWNYKYGAPIPLKGVLPVFSAYADAPWEYTTEQLSPSVHYTFNPTRNDTAIREHTAEDEVDENGWRIPCERYPFAMCEIGAGMKTTYLRRPLISGMDAYALSLVKLGCGNNLLGYYMYHGGTNKVGKYSAFNESKSSGYPNDYEVLNYDFHTAIGQYGQIRPQYGLLNMLHMFVNDFGDVLAPMEFVPAANIDTENIDTANADTSVANAGCMNFNASAVYDPDDTEKLRYAMRRDENGGFVFVNHYQRYKKLNPVYNVEIDTGEVLFPSIDVVGDISFIFPFNLTLKAEKMVKTNGADAIYDADAASDADATYDVNDANNTNDTNDTYKTLKYATAQLLCKTKNTCYFAQIPGIEAKYCIDGVEYVGHTCNEINNSNSNNDSNSNNNNSNNDNNIISDSMFLEHNTNPKNVIDVGNGIEIVTLTWEQACSVCKKDDKVVLNKYSFNVLGKEMTRTETDIDVQVVGSPISIDTSFIYADKENETWLHEIESNPNELYGRPSERMQRQLAEKISQITDIEEKNIFAEELLFGDSKEIMVEEITAFGNTNRNDSGQDNISLCNFVNIKREFDVAQIYADGQMVADIFYTGESWEIPIELLYGKKCYLIMSERKSGVFYENEMTPLL